MGGGGGGGDERWWRGKGGEGGVGRGVAEAMYGKWDPWGKRED